MKTLLAVLLIAGCASKAGGTAGTSRKRETFAIWVRADAVPIKRVLSAPVEKVWSALPRVFADMGYAAGPAADRLQALLS